MIDFLAHSHDHYNQSFDWFQELIELPIGIFHGDVVTLQKYLP